MAYLYFCKVNINDEIYEVYKKKRKVADIIDHLIVNVNHDACIDITEKKETIKFITLTSDIEKGFISGRLVKIFTDDLQIYNELTDDVEALPREKLARICTFYFDAKAEIVAFTLGRYFGAKQFCSYFEQLINLCTEEGMFNVNLIQDKDVFREKLKHISKAQEIEIDLVAENSCEEAINRVYANPKSLEEMEANSLKLNYKAGKKGNGLNLENSYLQKFIDALGLGYIKFIKVIGKNVAGLTESITSDEKAPKRYAIPDREKLSIPAVHEHGRSFIPNIARLISGNEK